MAKNIFEIWKENGEILPFAVRRDNWSNNFYTIVESVVVTTWPYGVATGYPTNKGNPSDHYSYDKKWRERRVIPSAGCYQWTLASDAEIVSFVADNNTKIDNKNSRVFNKSTLDENSILTFGKYNGRSISEILSLNPEYLNWMADNVKNVVLHPDLLAKLDKSGR